MNDAYASFVEEAYIKPIRSVLIVDDQYPTIDEIIDEANGGDGAKSGWKDTAAEIKKVITEFRGSGRPYLLDIHDAYPHGGKAKEASVGTKEDADNQEREVAEHLHQTDLLVLDYNLEPGPNEDGSLAISIVRKILRNAHFNLCIVHTKKELAEVFPDVLIGILSPIAGLFDKDEWKAANEKIESKFSDDPDFVNDISGELKAAVSDPIFFLFYQLLLQNSRDIGLAYEAFREDASAWPRLKKILDKYKVPVGDQKVFVLEAIEDFQISNEHRLSKGDLAVAAWSAGNEGEPPWIRSNHGFLAFTKKDDGPLFDKLRQALIAWGPRPSRLLATVVRSEIDERGIEVQDRSLGDQFAAANWYLDLLQKADAERDYLIDETVRYHSEQILAEILSNVSDFMRRLTNAERETLEGKRMPSNNGEGELTKLETSDFIGLVKERYGIDLGATAQAERAKFAHNVFVCSKPISGWHLQTGHILKIDDRLWCCLSPACDLVPDRAKPDFPDYFDGLKRFTAVRVDEVTPKQALKDATKGHHVFFHTPEGPLACRFVKGSNSPPVWATFYAKNEGRIEWESGEVDTPQDLRILRLERTEPAEEDQEARFDLIERQAKIVAQLRYEYALNLLQTLGGSVMRIGLDFSGS